MALRNRILAVMAIAQVAVMAFMPMACAKKPPTPVAVSGKVAREGKGLAWIRVVFWPRDPNIRRVETVSGAGGDFSLECPPGAYVVTVGAASSGGPPIPDSNMPTTPDTNRPNRTEKSAGIPDRYQERQKTPLNVEIPPSGKNDVVLEIEK